jgi:hypothetical protein
MKLDVQEINKQLADRSYAEVRTKHCYMTIERRPHYCDRGRYIVKCTVTGNPIELTVDEADMFPHYYFSFEAMISEVESWLKARNETVVA